MTEELDRQIEALEAEIGDLSNQREEIRLKAKTLTEQRDDLVAQREAAKITEGMTDEQKAHLAQTIHPKGISSEEAF